jgi:hypothetical protein
VFKSLKHNSDRTQQNNRTQTAKRYQILAKIKLKNARFSLSCIAELGIKTHKGNVGRAQGRTMS